MIRNRDVSLYAVGMLLQQAVTFVSGVVVARWLGPGDYGVLSLARNVFTVALILAPLGLDLSLLRHIGRHSRTLGELNRDITVLRGIVMVVNVAVAVVVFVLAPLVERHLFPHPGFAEALVVAFLALPFSADLAILGAVYRGRQRPATQVLVGLYCVPILRLITTIGLLSAGIGVVSALYATVITSFIAVVVLSVQLRRINEMVGAVAAPSSPVDVRALRQLLVGSAWLALGLLAYGLLRSVDIFVLGAFRSDEEVGEYAALSVIAQVILVLPQALSQTMGAVIARQHADGDTAALKSSLRSYLRRASLITAPVFAGIAIFAPWLDLVFGEKFHFRADVALLLASACYVGAVLAPMGYALSMTGRHRIESALLVVGVVAAAVVCWSMVPAFGQVGAAAGIFLGYVLINAVRISMVSRLYKVRLIEWEDALPPILAVGAAIIARDLGGAVLGRTLFAMVSLCAIYVTVCFVTWWVLVLKRDEKEFLTQQLSRIAFWGPA